MSWKAMIIMLLLAGLALVLTWVMGPPGQGAAPARTPSTLVDADELSPGDIDAIRVSKRDGKAAAFQREGDTWWQVEPIRHRAQTVAMLALVESALQMEVLDELEDTDPESLKLFDLLPPRGTIRFAFDGNELVFELGRTGIGGRGYLRQNGTGPVLVTNGNLHTYVLDQDPVRWRDRLLFPGIGIDIDHIERLIGDSRIVVEREGAEWRMTSPISTRLDQDAMARHVIELVRSSWSDVILEEPDDLAVFGLDPPAASIRIRHGEDVLVLHVGERLSSNTEARSAIVEGVPVVLRLESDTVGSILSDPVGLIDRTGSGVQPADVKRIVIESDGSTLVLERELDTWTAPDHEGRVVPSEPVESLLESLTRLRATEVEIKDYPAELERARVTLHGFGGRPLDTIRLLRETGDSSRWGMENGDGVIRIHPEFLVLPLRAADYELPGDTP